MMKIPTDGLPLAIATTRKRLALAQSLTRPSRNHHPRRGDAPPSERGEGAILLSNLEAHFQRYAALARGVPLVLSLWSLATYLFDMFDAFPYLAITSPTKQCGKTRVAELLEFVCSNPRRTVGISVAALFRTIEAMKPTLLIDEAESLRGREERATALREVLNAGYRRGQKVIRCDTRKDKGYKPQEFETFCPKALVLIGSLPDTLADRCIPVEMRRRGRERLERFLFARVRSKTLSLRTEAQSWAERNRETVLRWYEKNDIQCLEDREAELWMPLFAVCAIAAPQRLPELEAIASQVSGVKASGESGDLGIRLLADIRAAFDSERTDRLSTEMLLPRLNGMRESPWPGWSQGRGLDARSLSNLLRSFKISPKDIRLGEKKVVKGYERGDFEDAWSRYLPFPASPAATSATELVSQQDKPNWASATDSPCSGWQS